MATEKVQFELWALQCARNVWRKAAHKLLVNGHARFGTFDDGAAPDPVHRHEQAALDVFREKVEQDVSSAVPSFRSTAQQIEAAAALHADLLAQAADAPQVAELLALLKGGGARVAQGVSASDASGVAEAAFDGEQEQEQEEEQEKEQEQQQQKEQEVEVQEVDEFRREKYARDDEHTKAWPLTALGAPPKPMADPRSAPAGAAQAGFYPASEFAVHRSLLGGNDGGLHWPPSLLLSSEHTHPRWRFTSHRRLKNVIVVMEWAPPGAPPPAVALLPPTEAQHAKLRRARELYDREGAGKLGAAALGHALTDALGLLPEDDEERAAAAKLSANGAAAQEVQRLLHEKPFLRGADGRYWVALSLREAESLRGALHICQDEGRPVAAGANVGLRLGTTLLDGVGGGGGGAYAAPRRLQLESAVHAFRFIDCQPSYTPPQCRLLLRMLAADPPEARARWFADVCA